MNPPNNRNDTKARYVRGLFSEISSDYDLMNRLMSMGMDISWRRLLLAAARVPRGGMVLDVGTGTGDIAFEALRADPTVRATGVDFTTEMMEIGRGRNRSGNIRWVQADAMRLPFTDAVFDAVVSGFLMRNVTDVSVALGEQMRVLKPGGHLVCLDTTPPGKGILKPAAQFYLKIIIPLLGKIITGKTDAYKYLTSSTINFIKAETMADIMTKEGLEDVAFKRLMFGNIALHWGVRPK
jgi:demethylmenaquinone methyltransferase / 2-methoxy-6-polyprenyl-1,4-benzoquinol methylase